MKRAWYGMAAAGLAVVVGTALIGARAAPRTVPAPAAVAFSHRTHAGDKGIACTYCHRFARDAEVASLPTVETCVRCHAFLGAPTPAVQPLLEHWAQKRPLIWIRVHDLPDFVTFSHKRHVRAGVDCVVCHGEVARMNLAERVAPLTMGWCLACHRERQASVDCATCHK